MTATTKKSSNGQVKSTENIKDGWLALAAAAQKELALDGARGYVKLTIKVVVHDLDVQAWLPLQVERISPLSISNGGINPHAALLLTGVMEME